MFTPHTKADVEAMLKTIGVGKVDDLFNVVPESNRFPKLNLPQPLSEMEAAAELDSIASATPQPGTSSVSLAPARINTTSPPR